MDVATVDYWATAGRSYLHSASPLGKVAAGALGLAAVVVVQNLFVVLALYLVALAAARRSRLPLGKFVAASMYPGVFAFLFALAQYHGNLVIPLTTIAKAVTAASIVLLVIFTTPYPRLFAASRLFLPGVIVDVLYVTYRSVFIMLRLLGQVFTAVRLRGGFLGRNVSLRVRNLAAALGVAVIHSFDVSERTYAVMRVRGYSGRISGERAGGPAWRDAPLIAVAGALATIAFLFRFEWRALNPYSWFPLALAGAVFVLAVVVPAPPVRRAP